MKGDFSRFTFSPFNNYLSVLRQQGRIELDSDWNEQAEIMLELFRQLTSDLLGHFAVPLASNEINHDNSNALAIGNYSFGPGGVFDFEIGKGLAYVGGYPLIFPEGMTFRTQPDFPEPDTPSETGDLLVFIEVWKRTISFIDDEWIREPALGGPDTCLRSKLVGQVKIIPINGITDAHDAYEFLKDTFPASNVVMTMQIMHSGHQIPMSFGEVDMGGGMIPGNLHYRIEFHQGIKGSGKSCEGIKWADDNAAIVAKALKAQGGNSLLVEEPEQVTGESLKEGDWIEISNTITEMHRQGSQMARIASLESSEQGLLVKFDSNIHPLLARFKNGGQGGRPFDPAPRLRRWSGYVDSLAMKTVYDLGHGIKVTLQSPERKWHLDPGDYWTYAIRDKEYNKRHMPQKAIPSGIRKFRHPLAIIRREDKKHTGDIIDCRRFFGPMAELAKSSR